MTRLLTISEVCDMTRESYIRALRETEAAVLPRLDLIVTPPGKRKERPTAEFAKLLNAVRSRSALVVDIWHKARSDDAKSWDNALDAALPDELHGVSRESLDRLFGGRT